MFESATPQQADADPTGVIPEQNAGRGMKQLGDYIFHREQIQPPVAFLHQRRGAVISVHLAMPIRDGRQGGSPRNSS